MPKLTRSIPAYRKHRASGQAIVSLNGRDFYLGPWGTKASRLEYDRLIGEWLQHGRQLQPDAENEGLTIVELIAPYLHFAERYYRKGNRTTSEIYGVRSALRYVKLLYGRKPCTEFGPIALQAVRDRMIADGLARGTINDYVDRIRRMFRWGVSQQLIPAVLADALASVPGLRKGYTDAKETKRVRAVNDATVQATLLHLPEVVGDMVRVQLLCGCRPGEVCLMRPCDIDRSGDVWLFAPGSHKTEHHDKRRCIFLGPQSQQVLLKYLARDPAMYCFRPVDSEAKRRAGRHAARVVPIGYGNRPGLHRVRKPKRAAGDRYTTDSYRRAIARGCESAFAMPSELRYPKRGLKKRPEAERHAEYKRRLLAAAKWRESHCWHPNQLRHAAGTAVRKQFGVEVARLC
jgi:integrase